MPFWQTEVIVVGRVARVRPLAQGGWRVRLSETGGQLRAAEIRVESWIPLPPLGARIVLHGGIRYDDVHGWYAVDPVRSWRFIGYFR